jgi:hypothetical protein
LPHHSQQRSHKNAEQQVQRLLINISACTTGGVKGIGPLHANGGPHQRPANPEGQQDEGQDDATQEYYHPQKAHDQCEHIQANQQAK